MTESFLIVLSEFASLEPEAFSSLIDRLTGGFLSVDPGDAKEVRFSTQFTMDLGRPDVQIRFRDQRALIEVKDESPFGDRQVERYRTFARASSDGQTILILLTRYPLDSAGTEEESGDCAHRWIHVSEWIDDEIRVGRIRTPVGMYLADEFHRFLAERGLTMQKVETGLTDGLGPLKNLLEMLYEAAGRSRIPVSKTELYQLETIGVAIDKTKFHVGIRFSEPGLLQFRTAEFPVNADRAKRLGVGEVYPSEYPAWTKGPYRWRNIFDLTSANSAFYSAGKSEQLRQIELFLRQSLQAAAQIEGVPS